jgi:hypothetical protein
MAESVPQTNARHKCGDARISTKGRKPAIEAGIAALASVRLTPTLPSMNATNDPLWHKLDAFAFDHPGDALTFTRRLARENRWSSAFANRVVDEYRRFLFLALRAGHPVTPSDEIDQAWHLHLVYTRSYWEDLCEGVLQRPLHHGPTRGGAAEDDRFEQQYVETQASYAKWFGHEPPADIWPPGEVRFAPQARFARVNTAAFWMLPKQRVRSLVAACMVVSLSLMALAACTWTSDDLSFGNVFPFVILLLIIGLAIRSARRGGGGGKGGGGCTTGCDGSGCSSHHDSSGCGSSGCSSGCGGGCGGD